MPQYSHSRLLTDAEVAQYLGVSIKTVRRLRGAQRIGCVCVEGRRYVRTLFRQVLEFIDAATRDATVALSSTPRANVRRNITSMVALDNDEDMADFRRAYSLSKDEGDEPQPRRRKSA